MINKELKGKTAIITGASSGIGKAMALTLAKAGFNLILAARRETLLQEVASECEALGGLAIAVRADVTNFSDVENLIGKARTFYGKIDVWINNAGVGAVGEFTKTPLDIHEQIIKTNLLGQIYGAYAILPYFKSRNKGIIINTISLSSFVPTPFSATYSASKFGLRGFTEAMKAELLDFPDIHVCDVHPAFVDTPGISHMANFTHRKIELTPPLQDPFDVADRVLKLILNPKDSVVIGARGKIARFFYSIAPHFVERFMARATRTLLSKLPETKYGRGNIFTPVPEGKTARGTKLKSISRIQKIYNEFRPGPSL